MQKIGSFRAVSQKLWPNVRYADTLLGGFCAVEFFLAQLEQGPLKNAYFYVFTNSGDDSSDFFRELPQNNCNFYAKTLSLRKKSTQLLIKT